MVSSFILWHVFVSYNVLWKISYFRWISSPILISFYLFLERNFSANNSFTWMNLFKRGVNSLISIFNNFLSILFSFRLLRFFGVLLPFTLNFYLLSIFSLSTHSPFYLKSFCKRDTIPMRLGIHTRPYIEDRRKNLCIRIENFPKSN